MKIATAFQIGLIIRSGAYQRRSAREQLDVALIAASLDCEVHLYFVAHAVLQLIPRGELQASGLPAGYRAWASLPGIMENRNWHAFAEVEWLDRLKDQKIATALELRGCSPLEMRKCWADCDRVLVL